MYLLAAILLLGVSSFTLFPVFSLALWGDDFLTIWRYLYLVGGSNPRPEWNHLTYFLTPYGPQDIATGLLYKAFGVQAQYYHLTSIIFRLIAATSLIPVVFYLTKSRLAAFFAVLFFLVTVIGFDTTNWVFNMTSYISLAFFNLFLYFFLRSRESSSVKLLLFSGLFFYLTFVFSPIRMTGLLPFVFIIESLYLIQNLNLKGLKKVGTRIVLIIAVMTFITLTGQSTGPKTDLSQRFLSGLSTATQLLSQGRFDFLFYPILMFGSMFVPDIITPNFPTITKKWVLFQNILLPFLLVFIFILFIFKKNITTLRKGFILKNGLMGGIWCLLVSLIHLGNMTTFSDPKAIFLLLIGGFTLIITFSLYFEYHHQKNLSNAILYSIIWAVISFFPAWFWLPTNIYPAYYRYLIGSGIGVSIFLSAIIALGQTSAQRVRLFMVVCLFLIIQIIATRIYLNQLVNAHGIDLSNRIWSQMPYFPQMGKTDIPLIFYFQGDNNIIVHNVLFFNFDYRNALLYNIWDDKIPLVMGDWPSVVSAVTDGKIFKAYGRPQKPLPIDHIYAFHLEGKDKLINITDEVRQKLREISQKQ